MLGKLSDGRLPVEQETPELAQIVYAGETARHPDDGDIGGCATHQSPFRFLAAWLLRAAARSPPTGQQLPQLVGRVREVVVPAVDDLELDRVRVLTPPLELIEAHLGVVPPVQHD